MSEGNCLQLGREYEGIQVKRKGTERYSTIQIADLEERIEKELLPAAYRICRRIEEFGKEELQERLKQYITNKCPLRRCAVLREEPQECPRTIMLDSRRPHVVRVRIT
jgi:hypothetical protein